MDYVDAFRVSPCPADLSALRILPEVFGNFVDCRKMKIESEFGGLKARIPVVFSASMDFLDSDFFEKFASSSASFGVPISIGENSFFSLGAKALKEKLSAYSSNMKKLGGIILQANIHDLQQKSFEKINDLGINCLQLSICNPFPSHLNSVAVKTKEADRFEKAGYLIAKAGDTANCYPISIDMNEEKIAGVLEKTKELDFPVWIRASVGSGIFKLFQLLQKLKRENDYQLQGITIEGARNHARLNGETTGQLLDYSLPSPSLFAGLDERPSFDIAVNGNYFSGQDIAKIMMLGAKSVEVPVSDTIAPSIADTKKNEFELSMKKTECELRQLCASQRIESLSDFYRKKKNLFANTREAADLFGVPCNPKMIF